MVKVTIEVPESLLSELYTRVGVVLNRGRNEAEQVAEQAAAPEPSDGDQAAEED